MYSPMMQQYLEIKNQHKDCLVFFRLGDFYELFFEDAKIVSRELDLTLTGKDCGLRERVPMCGVPYQSVDNYINKLIDRNYKIAIAEQTEETQKNKSLIKREVTRIVTRGTLVDINKSENNFIACVYKNKLDYGIALIDISTGEFLTFGLININSRKLIDEIAKFNPVEIITNGEFDLEKKFLEIFNIKTEFFFEWAFDYLTAHNKICEHFKILNLYGFGLANNKHDRLCVCAAGALLEYLSQIRKKFQAQITCLKKYISDKFMSIDIYSRRNLELIKTNREKNKTGSLLCVLDKTKTAMGSRLIKKFIEQPLLDCEKINQRLDAVEELFINDLLRDELRKILSNIYDFERILSKIAAGFATPKDLLCLLNSIENFGDIKNLLSKFNCEYIIKICHEFDILADIFDLLDKSLMREINIINHREGNFIKAKFDKKLDELREIKNNSKKIILELEQRERKLTGIKNLKIKDNKIFGYYIEISKSAKNRAPKNYIVKQTLANCERYFTQDLKDLEEEIYNANTKINLIEQEIFLELINKICLAITRVQASANLIALLDVLSTYAEIAKQNNYKKPIVNQKEIINIKNGRHPVVEKFVESGFIANDCYLDLRDERIYLITGPNMVGKSTYMRQIALIIIMAQSGCFVPADYAEIGIVDKIFTRVGASDDLATGQSTFMIEMNEIANILHGATRKSFVIIDEVGRGTSTCDGLSIAWSVIEYISREIGCKTLFATHYHELTALEKKIDGLKNYCADVKKNGDKIIFLRKIIPGAITNSYGIYVAELAGLPSKLLIRAKEIFLLLDNTQKNSVFDLAFEAQEIFYDNNN